MRPMARVLVVDNDSWFEQLAVEMLVRLGHQPTVARTSAEAYRLLENERFDAVLLDLVMREENGPEVMAHLAARVELPILTTSGGGGQKMLDILSWARAG